MSSPPILGLEKLKQHLEKVEDLLVSSVQPEANLKLQLDEMANPIVAGIVGDGCERAARTRGLDTPVAPWINLRQGLWSWLGYREEWSIQTTGRHPTFAFKNSSITVHFGYKATDPKPQMFRAEWAGPVLTGTKWSMQGGDAGHPHWQFDAMDSLLAPARVDQANMFAEILRSEETTQTDLSVPNVGGEAVADLVAARSLAAIHFASAAPWWLKSDAAKHAHVPKDAGQLREWLRRTLLYISQELERV